MLHTWNQKLQIHPHVHCVVPAGGLSLDHTRWIRSHPRFFLPIPVLREVFRGKFVDALKLAFQRGQLHLSGDLARLAHPKFFAAWLRPLFRKNWVVYSKPPFGGPEYVLQYLGRYTRRVAISNHRLVSLANGQVTFHWRDSAHNNEQKLMTLALDEFLRRFLLHLLPKGFVRIRHFGLLANRRRSTLLPLCFAALGTVPMQIEPETSTQESDPLWRCPKCGGPMAVIERLPQLKSNSVLHLGCSQLRHETASPQLKTLHGSPRSTPVRPAPDLIPNSRHVSHRFHYRFLLPRSRQPPLRFRADSLQLQHLSLAPFNLHKTRVHRASGFLLTAFSNARPNPLFRSTLITKGDASEKALASLTNKVEFCVRRKTMPIQELLRANRAKLPP